MKGEGGGGGAVFDEEDVPDDAVELQWCLLGKFMTVKSIHFQLMQNTCGCVKACERHVFPRSRIQLLPFSVLS